MGVTLNSHRVTESEICAPVYRLQSVFGKESVNTLSLCIEERPDEREGVGPAVVKQAISLALACKEETMLNGKILFSASSDFGCVKPSCWLISLSKKAAAGSLFNSEVQRPEL